MKSAANLYSRLILLSFLLLLLFRVIEVSLIVAAHSLSGEMLWWEVLGLFSDFFFFGIILLLLFPLYALLLKVNQRTADLTIVVLLFVFGVLHILILEYFAYELKPLDIFLYNTTFREMLFTVETSGKSYLPVILYSILVLVIGLFALKMIKAPGKLSLLYGFLMLCIPVSILLSLFREEVYNVYSRNKSLYFYGRSIGYLFSEEKDDKCSRKDLLTFQENYPGKKYLDPNYPFLHTFDAKDQLGAYLNRSDTAPNVVFLFVEGLNDDYLHDYRGLLLMPFTNSLMQKSLYWTKCFTLGERSFAVTPSVLGSLPYGDEGFMAIPELPAHFSMVNVLNANDYHTSFFYGQGSWFHSKDRFFNANAIDHITDHSNFLGDYKKIIVGADNYFWGYNDKNLFAESFTVIKGLPQHKRLDVYFTGTTHNPFVIEDEPYYDALFKEHLAKLKSEEDKKFFNSYRKNIRSILFTDDALRDFFAEYQKRPEYKNTIFIITGDHPMTEIPIKNSLKRYHVPLMIFSPLLKNAKSFDGVVSHLDIYETLLAHLAAQYAVKVPSVSTALGGQLNFGAPANNYHLTFMDGNRNLYDFFADGYFIDQHKLYKVDDQLMLEEMEDEDLLANMHTQLELFKKLNYYVSFNDKLLPEKYLHEGLGMTKLLEKTLKKDSFASEYFGLIPATPIKNNFLHFDINIDLTMAQGDSCSLVYELYDNNMKSLLWMEVKITKEKHIVKRHIKIPLTREARFFKSYLWNQSKKVKQCNGTFTSYN